MDFFLSSQGQVEAHVSLQAGVPEDAEFYVAVQGSELTHVAAAKRGADGLSLCFTVPGMSFRWPQVSLFCHIIAALTPIMIISISQRSWHRRSCHCHIILLHRGPSQAMRRRNIP